MKNVSYKMQLSLNKTIEKVEKDESLEKIKIKNLIGAKDSDDDEKITIIEVKDVSPR